MTEGDGSSNWNTVEFKKANTSKFNDQRTTERKNQESNLRRSQAREVSRLGIFVTQVEKWSLYLATSRTLPVDWGCYPATDIFGSVGVFWEIAAKERIHVL